MIVSRHIPVAAFAALFSLAACQSGPTKEELETAKKTIDCKHDDQRVLIRFEEGEAWLLSGETGRTVLYQIAAPSGLRYTNGLIELRGRGMEFTLIRDGNSVTLTCKQFEIPKKE